MKHHKHTLPNNLTILTVPMPHTEATMAMAMVHAGSRNEDLDEKGLAHFTEHMAFKGGKLFKKPKDVAISVDGIGGDFNAFTAEEVTAYYIRAAKEHIQLSLDVLADLVIHPRFPTDELEKEKGVIVEEINMYEDMPKYKAEIELGSLIYKDHPLGWNIAGEKKTVTAFNRQIFTRFHQKMYVGHNITVILAGAVNDQAVKEVEKRFKVLPAGRPESHQAPIEDQVKPAIHLVNKTSEQTHLAMGIRALGITDPRRYIYKVMSIILGGNMSSRLFLNIRERQGLSYYISASTQAFTDTGYLEVNAGVDNKRVLVAIKSIMHELALMRDKQVTKEELDRAKEFMIGRIKLSLEDSEQIARLLVSQQVLENTIQTPEEIITGIKAVTVNQIQKLMQEIFQAKNINLSLVGPNLEESRLQKILNEL